MINSYQLNSKQLNYYDISAIEISVDSLIDSPSVRMYADDGYPNLITNEPFELLSDIEIKRALLLYSNQTLEAPTVETTFSRILDIDMDSHLLTVNLDSVIRPDIRMNVDSTLDSPDLDTVIGEINIYQIDYNKDTLVISNSGATAFNGTQKNQDQSLGGYPSYNRIHSYSIYRSNPIENLNILFASGNNAEGEVYIEMFLDSDDIYYIKYKDSDSSSFGSPVVVKYDEKLKVTNGNKYILVEIAEDIVVNKYETISIRYNYNNVIAMNNFDTSGTVTEYRGIFLKNQHNENISDIKIWFDNNSKITTRYALELPISREIQTIPDTTTAPIDISGWYSFTDSTSATPLLDLGIAEFVGIWLENTYDSTSVSPYEMVSMNLSYTKGADTITSRVVGLTRGYNSYYDDKYKFTYNINDTIDGTGATEVIISETDLTGGYSVLDVTGVGETLTDGDFIYYDLQKINRYGIEAFPNLNQYYMYDSSSGLYVAPNAPSSGNVLYSNSGNMMIQAIYYPNLESSKGNIDEIRANKWVWKGRRSDLEDYLWSDTTSSMNVAYGAKLEAFSVQIDQSGILDNTPLTFEIYTCRDSIQSETPLILTGTVNKQVAVNPIVNTLIGYHYGLNRKNLAAIDSTSVLDASGNIYLEFGDGRTTLFNDTELIFKYFYKEAGSIFNKFYLNSTYSLVEESGFDTSSGITDNSIWYELESDILYLLVNCERVVKLDLTNKTFEINDEFNALTTEELYSDETVFLRFTDTVLQVWNIENQILIPYLIIKNNGSISCLGEFSNELNQTEIEAIV